ncbi:deoxyguanosinetriphosphate triphosphohydrolase [Calothrix sp. NIES-3974]|uniref:deoxyguanosinetriphosphate triphosphohydrolase n=1 Tax=Calothrix sp. NIES-3974 TaxID=2005462 RepID=UPI000B5F8711|nr:deoxyguanosinetriphosphate triphosphohydrolase [Calothrix sp. NIES-3974]BAZ03960.1 deoxyguanosinetriphosphate triphosphohydrolase [Calothrix sp. NIES-3974]
MEWQKLLTPQRLGKKEAEDIRYHRTPFHKDYDRIVFSSPFRRLKDKTQVFSLAKNDYIRTRLIHSLEVSCVGRSLGRIVGYDIVQRHHLDNLDLSASDFGDIVAAACLAHDIGNPPFGHSGEDAIQTGFKNWYNQLINSVESLLSIAEKTDLDLFEGNAQGFRILTKLETQPRLGGMRLTCPTLAAFTKYPRESYIPPEKLNGYTGCSVKKYGFFQAEKELFSQVAQQVGLIRRHPDIAWWCRHPLAFLMEAADDICYSIVDVEDGYRMGYISFEQARDLLAAIANLDLSHHHASNAELIKHLRAKSINNLVDETASIFLDFESEILAGKFDNNLLKLSKYLPELQNIATTVSTQVFLHPDVLETRIAGYEVLGKLFTDFIDAVLSNSKKSELILLTLPEKYRPFPNESLYNKILRITDYISGMSDSYATSIFKKYSGISLG